MGTNSRQMRFECDPRRLPIRAATEKGPSTTDNVGRNYSKHASLRISFIHETSPSSSSSSSSFALRTTDDRRRLRSCVVKFLGVVAVVDSGGGQFFARGRIQQPIQYTRCVHTIVEYFMKARDATLTIPIYYALYVFQRATCIYHP